ncbi:hypothetical protein K431DRAFT_117623 [Polychaeton citri CBS 116435]|uniref:Uncharacterized protein n=1 Tax=Polychaeton citri CBS 116435 TaxID=1314669 RepID=A0A9P4QHV4_9PEZI|nr:hypothetical protein K431DRAFT_117623 [Polychaeton citri CBS 116435]
MMSSCVLHDIMRPRKLEKTPPALQAVYLAGGFIAYICVVHNQGLMGGQASDERDVTHTAQRGEGLRRCDAYCRKTKPDPCDSSKAFTLTRTERAEDLHRADERGT